jgi:hypothetical protein
VKCDSTPNAMSLDAFNQQCKHQAIVDTARGWIVPPETTGPKLFLRYWWGGGNEVGTEGSHINTAASGRSAVPTPVTGPQPCRL